MLDTTDKQSLDVVRKFLDESSFSYMNYRQIPSSDHDIFPDFAQLHGSATGCSPIWRLFFTLFRQGHEAEEIFIREIFPDGVFDALVSLGLLVETRLHTWRTPGIGLVAFQGLWLWVSLPPYYPTKLSAKQPVYLGFDSTWLTQALPSSMRGRHVIDVCSGSSIQGLVCAARGASRVVCLEKNPEAIPIARFNIALNGFEEQVEVRETDLYSAVRADERFDFFVSNPPFMPVVENVDYPMCGDGGADGEVVMRRIFGELAPFMTKDCQGVAFCNVLGSQTAINFNEKFMAPWAEKNSYVVRAFIDGKIPMADYVSGGLDSNLARSCPELSEKERGQKAKDWLDSLSKRGVAAEYVYSQILRFWGGEQKPQVFWRSKDEPAYSHCALYDKDMTDPLVGFMTAVRASA